MQDVRGANRAASAPVSVHAGTGIFFAVSLPLGVGKCLKSDRQTFSDRGRYLDIPAAYFTSEQIQATNPRLLEQTGSHPHKIVHSTFTPRWLWECRVRLQTQYIEIEQYLFLLPHRRSQSNFLEYVPITESIISTAKSQISQVTAVNPGYPTKITSIKLHNCFVEHRLNIRGHALHSTHHHHKGNWVRQNRRVHKIDYMVCH